MYTNILIVFILISNDCPGVLQECKKPRLPVNKLVQPQMQTVSCRL